MIGREIFVMTDDAKLIKKLADIPFVWITDAQDYASRKFHAGQCLVVDGDDWFIFIVQPIPASPPTFFLGPQQDRPEAFISEGLRGFILRDDDCAHLRAFIDLGGSGGLYLK